MKTKFSKILGVGLTLALVFALTAGFALPVGASPDENAWSKFAYPAEGEAGGWFYNPGIGGVGPIAKAIDGTLYAATGVPAVLETAVDGTAEWSTTKAYSGSYSAKLYDGNTPHTSAGRVVIPDVNIPLADIDTLSYWFNYTAAEGSPAEGAYAFPYMILAIDTTGDTDADEWIVLHSGGDPYQPAEGSWVQWDLDEWDEWFDAVGSEIPDFSSLAAAQAAYPDADVVAVKVAVGEGWAVGVTAYVDDITINGTTYPLERQLFKSTDDGRSWALTLYSDATYGVAGETIVAIACSSIDADIVYVADADLVYKTEDGGDTFDFVSKSTLEDLMANAPFVNNDPVITSLAVGYVDEKPHVYIGVAITGNAGGVGYIYDVAFGGGWTDLELDYSVYGIGASPDFDNDALVVAVATSGGQTFACSNYGAAPAAWGEVELKDEDGVSYAITEASDPAFPEDFDVVDAYEFFVGVVGAAHTTSGDGGVYRVYDTFDLLDNVDADIISLDLVGEVGDTMLLAGQDNVADVWYSTNDGDTWKNALDYGIRPTGGGPTYVVMDDDFATNDTAWAATAGAEAAVSLSVDGGEIWHGISLISTDIDAVRGVGLSPAYAADETLFMLTRADDEDTESVLKYDGANWTRVFESTLYGATDEADLVAVSPDFTTDETVFIGCTGNQQIFRSTDIGISFVEQRVAPTAITAWTIIDSDTIIAGGNGTIYKTENYGRRAWAAYAITSAGSVGSFAVVGETIMVGDAAGAVFVSEDAGENWEQVGDATSIFDTAALVASDGDVIYAASGGVVGRCVIDTDEDWADQSWEAFTVAATIEAAGIVISPDGTLYVVDATDETDSEEVDDVNGAQRCLNPAEADVDDAVFEAVDYKLSADAELALAGFTVGSNVLWAIDGAAAQNLYTYEDTLATEVSLSSPMNATAVTDTDKATLKWFELTGAGEYEVVVNTRDDFLAGTQVFTDNDVEETWVTAKPEEGLDPGTTYYWRVRVATGEPLLSRWSETRSFITALARPTPPLMWFPDIGADDVPIEPVFSWAEVTGATNYKIIVATEPSFSVASRLVETMVTTHFYSCDVRLSYNTTYYWRVKAYSDSVVVSDWTAGMFTTMAKAVPPTPPVEITPPPPTPEVTVEVPPAVEVIVPAAQVISPTWIYVIIGVGAVLAIAVIVLIVRTRRVT